MGDIYLLTSPSGKHYVGQCLKFYSNGKKNGYINRWKQHIYEAKKFKTTSTLLNNALRLYDPEEWKVELLAECEVTELDAQETHFIEMYGTLTPNGYNLTTGGKKYSYQSEETKKKKSESQKGKNLGRVMEKRTRLREEDSHLPKYIRSIKDGYRISNHPSKMNACFRSKQLTMDVKLKLVLAKLDEFNKLC